MKPEIDWTKISNLDILPHQELDWIEYKGRRAIDLTLNTLIAVVDRFIQKLIQAEPKMDS